MAIQNKKKKRKTEHIHWRRWDFTCKRCHALPLLVLRVPRANHIDTSSTFNYLTKFTHLLHRWPHLHGFWRRKNQEAKINIHEHIKLHLRRVIETKHFTTSIWKYDNWIKYITINFSILTMLINNIIVHLRKQKLLKQTKWRGFLINP